MASLVLSQVATSALAPSLYGFMANGASIAASAGLWSAAQAMTGALGALAGSALDRLLFEEKQNYQGPRLGDLTVQTSTEGASLPIVYGTMRIAGNVIWSTGLTEASKTEESGGDGSGGGGGSSITTYTYSTDCAIALCEGTITGIRRIWADTKLIYDVGSSATLETIQASAVNNIRFYTGSETQLCDPLIQAVEGTDLAYRGTAYVVFEDFQLADYGNRLPNFSFEVVNNGSSSGLAKVFESAEAPASRSIVSVKHKLGEMIKVITVGPVYPWNGTSYPTELNYWYIDSNGVWINRFKTYLHYLANYNWGSSFGYTNTIDYEDDTFVLCYPQSTSIAFLITLKNDVLIIKKLHQGGLSNRYNFVNADYVAFTTTAGTGFNISKRANLAPATVTMGSWGGYAGYGLSDSMTFFEAGHYATIALTGEIYRGAIVISDDYIYALTHGYPGYIYRINKAAVLTTGGTFTEAGLSPDIYRYGGFVAIRLGQGLEPNSVLLLADTTIVKTLDFVTWTTIGTSPYTFNNTRRSLGQVTNNLYWVNNDTRTAILSNDLITNSTVTLKSVAEDITARSGLPASKYNYSSLNATVKGYHIANKMPIKDALEPLTAAYTFDIIEEDSKIVAKPYSSSNTSIRTLTTQEVGTYNYD